MAKKHPAKYERCVLKVKKKGGANPYAVCAPLLRSERRYSLTRLPAVCASWDHAAKQKCIAAANYALATGHSDTEALAACVLAAGKMKDTKLTLSSDAVLQLRLAPARPGQWIALGAPETLQLGDVVVPVRRFKKDLIRTGSYIKLNDGIAFQVTLDTLANWVLQFKRMKAAGVKVPVPATHQPPEWEEEARAGDPRDNMGWVDDLWIEGDTLWMACTLRGADAIASAFRSDVSINSPPTYVDGKGNIYVRPITHVAMCTDPVIPGLGEFIPLAASLRLQTNPPAGTPTGGRVMLEFLQKLGVMLGLDPEAMTDEATASDMVLKAVEALVEKASTMPPEGAETANGGSPPASSGPVRKETVTREFAAALSQGENGETIVSPMLVKTLCENRRMKLDALVAKGKIAPIVRDKLAKHWAGEDTVKLALSVNSDGADFDALIEALEANPPVLKIGEKSGLQATMVLSDPAKANTPRKSPLVADAERRAERFRAR